MKDYSKHRFQRDGLTLVIRRFQAAPKTADAPAFVLVHGIGVSSRYYMRLARELASHSTVFTVDMPGFGRSPKPHPRRQLSVEDLAGLIRAFLAEAGVTSPVLVGHSMGTQIVTEMSVQDPALTDRIVLMGPVVDPAAPTAVGQAVRLARDVLAEPLIANWMVLTDYLRCGPRWYLTELPVMLGYPMVERLGRVSASVLLIRGGVDPVAPGDWVQHIESVVSRCARLDVAGSAHVVQHSGAPAVALALLVHAGIPDTARGSQAES
ncbi:alpha/beta fold hydrolase [Glaciibacter sp. 2TAF33]|uniref:alpha/beta fold hydrolase n=1 Tax=Glaciibacter sp. 2TAF33 TaxID=3233015 RepID=UPI003F8F9718